MSEFINDIIFIAACENYEKRLNHMLNDKKMDHMFGRECTVLGERKVDEFRHLQFQKTTSTR